MEPPKSTLTSQRKQLTRDPLTPWKRLFNDNVDSLIGVGHNNAVCIDLSRQRGDIIPKQYHTQRNMCKSDNNECQLDGSETVHCDTRDEYIQTECEQRNQTTNEDYLDESGIDSPIENQVGIKSVQYGYRGRSLTMDSREEILEQPRVLHLYRDGRKHKEKVMGGGHLDYVMKSQAYDTHGGLSNTPDVSLTEHRLSTRYVFCMSSATSNGSKIIIWIDNTINNSCGAMCNYANMSKGITEINWMCDDRRIKGRERIGMNWNVNREKYQNAEHVFLSHTSTRSKLVCSSKSADTDNTLQTTLSAGPNLLEHNTVQFDVNPHSKLTESHSNDRRKQQTDRQLKDNVSCTRVSFDANVVEGEFHNEPISLNSQPKPLTRNPSVVWKRLFDDNVISLVQNRFIITKAPHDSGISCTGYECVTTNSSHQCTKQESLTSHWDKYSFLMRRIELTGDKNPIARNQSSEDSKVRSKEMNVKSMNQVQKFTGFNFIEHRLSGHYLATCFYIHRQLNDFGSLDRVNRSTFFENRWKESNKRSKFTYHSARSLCSRRDNENSESRLSILSNVGRMASRQGDQPVSALSRWGKENMSENKITSKPFETMKDHGASGDVLRPSVCLQAGCAKPTENILIGQIPTFEEDFRDQKACGDHSGDKQNIRNEHCKEVVGELYPFNRKKHRSMCGRLSGFEPDNEKRMTKLDSNKSVKSLFDTDGKDASRNILASPPIVCDALEDFQNTNFMCEKTREVHRGDNLIPKLYVLSPCDEKLIYERTQIESKSRDGASKEIDLERDAKGTNTTFTEEHCNETNRLETSHEESGGYHNTSSTKRKNSFGENDFSVPSTSFQLPNELLQEFETTELTNTVNWVIQSSCVNRDTEKSTLMTGFDSKSNIDLLKMVSHELTDKTDALGTTQPHPQLTPLDQQCSETDKPSVYVGGDVTREEVNAQKNGSRDEKQKRRVPLINPFNVTTFEDTTDSLPTYTFNTRATRNDQTLSGYFKQQETTKDINFFHREKKSSKVDGKGTGVSKSKNTTSKYTGKGTGIPGDGIGNDRVTQSETGAVDAQVRTQGEIPGNTKCQSVDDLSESSLECLLEQLIQRGKVQKAFVMDTDGTLLARSKHTSVPPHTAKCFYDSLRGHYNGLMRIDGGDGNVYIGFKSADGAMLVGTSASSVTVCKRGVNAIVVGFARRDASGSCIKDMTELSAVIDKRGLR